MVARSWGFGKWGHSGTLDPGAAGVLPVLLGSGTKLSGYLTGGSKVYSFTLVMGIATETDDLEGPVIRRTDASMITREALIRVLDELTGTFSQTVPSYSAVRVDGGRAYAKARSGKKPEMPSRTVSVRNWAVCDLKEGRSRLRVEVSAGTYIRALARDAGEKLGVGAVADEITRERSAGFSLSECSDAPDDPRAMLTPLEAMRGYPERHLEPAEVEGVRNGLPVAGEAEGIVLLVEGRDRLIAVGKGGDGVIRPLRVLEIL